MSVNGILKPWKYLDRVLPNSEIPYIADYVKIACALMNGYWPELVTKDAVMEKQVASKMEQKNLLQEKKSLRDMAGGVLANGIN